MRFGILHVPVLLPLAAGAISFLIPLRVKILREALALLAAAAGFVAALWVGLQPVADARLPLLQIGAFDLGVDLALAPLSRLILPFAAGLGFLTCLYSTSYLAGTGRQREYYAFFLFALGGAAGVLTVNHLIALLVFWEIVTASLYFLICTGGPEARAGATKSFAMLGGGDGCLLLGIGLLWLASGSFTMSGLQVRLDGAVPIVAFVLLTVSAITKAGAMPLHSWIPAASEGAPASVMAFLPASVDKLLGIYLLAVLVTRVFVLTSAMGLALMIIGAVTIVGAVMVAMVQHDLRRLLAYHAVSQVGYMVLGIGTLTSVGIVGGVFHMLNNAIYKNCLFLCTGAVERRAGSTDLADLGGLARAMPATFVVFLVSALAISGVPPLNGFVSKWLVYQGIIEVGTNASLVFLVAAMFGSALTLASFVKAIYAAFLGIRSQRTERVKGDAGVAMLIPMIALALLCVVFGVAYSFPTKALMTGVVGGLVTLSGIWSSTAATGLIAVGLLVGVAIYLLGKYRSSARTVAPFTGGEVLAGDTGRIVGTHFYDTLKAMPLLKGAYAAQEKGRLDPYTWLGGLGLRITALLRRLHNGLLSWYLSWSLAGIIILAVLFSLFR